MNEIRSLNFSSRQTYLWSSFFSKLELCGAVAYLIHNSSGQGNLLLSCSLKTSLLSKLTQTVSGKKFAFLFTYDWKASLNTMHITKRRISEIFILNSSCFHSVGKARVLPFSAIYIAMWFILHEFN